MKFSHGSITPPVVFVMLVPFFLMMSCVSSMVFVLQSAVIFAMHVVRVGARIQASEYRRQKITLCQDLFRVQSSGFRFRIPRSPVSTNYTWSPCSETASSQKGRRGINMYFLLISRRLIIPLLRLVVTLRCSTDHLERNGTECLGYLST